MLNDRLNNTQSLCYFLTKYNAAICITTAICLGLGFGLGMASSSIFCGHDTVSDTNDDANIVTNIDNTCEMLYSIAGGLYLSTVGLFGSAAYAVKKYVDQPGIFAPDDEQPNVVNQAP